MTVRGFDISGWQGSVNWRALKDHADFVFIKATEGTSFIDPQFHHNVTQARANMVPHAFYHYINVQDPIREANHFVDTCKRVNGEGQSLDFEGRILQHSGAAGWAKSWLDHVHERTGNRPIPYMSGAVTDEFNWKPIVKEGYGLWEASWGSHDPNPGEWPFWAFWQTSETGHVAGIGGNVDTDVFEGSLAALKKYFANDGTGSHPAPTAPAPPHGKPVAPTHPSAPLPGYYTVREGDTLSGIAARYGTDYHELQRLNHLPSANIIHVGQRLQVHGAAAVKPKPTSTKKIYVVHSGDSMSEIANKHNESYPALLLKNPQIKHPNLIFPGEHVFV